MWTGLNPGAYVLEEVDAADGYNIIQSSETIMLADSGEQSVVTTLLPGVRPVMRISPFSSVLKTPLLSPTTVPSAYKTLNSAFCKVNGTAPPASPSPARSSA